MRSHPVALVLSSSTRASGKFSFFIIVIFYSYSSYTCILHYEVMILRIHNIQSNIVPRRPQEDRENLGRTSILWPM